MRLELRFRCPGIELQFGFGTYRLCLELSRRWALIRLPLLGEAHMDNRGLWYWEPWEELKVHG